MVKCILVVKQSFIIGTQRIGSSGPPNIAGINLDEMNKSPISSCGQPLTKAINPKAIIARIPTAKPLPNRALKLT